MYVPPKTTFWLCNLIYCISLFVMLGVRLQLLLIEEGINQIGRLGQGRAAAPWDRSKMVKIRACFVSVLELALK